MSMFNRKTVIIIVWIGFCAGEEHEQLLRRHGDSRGSPAFALDDADMDNNDTFDTAARYEERNLHFFHGESLNLFPDWTDPPNVIKREWNAGPPAPIISPSPPTPSVLPPNISPVAAPIIISPVAPPTTIRPVAAPTIISPAAAPSNISPLPSSSPSALSPNISPLAAPSELFEPSAAPSFSGSVPGGSPSAVPSFSGSVPTLTIPPTVKPTDQEGPTVSPGIGTN